jgi:hypothetical protein
MAWRRFEIPATMCPRIAAAFLAQERASLPRDVYEQEYCCRFIEAVGSVFDADDLAAMFGDDLAGVATEDEEYLSI